MIRKGDHDEVEMLLPWLVNGSLGAREERRVLNHLQRCADCRAERDRLQDLQQFIVEEDEAEAADYRFAFGKLMGRIEAHEANVESACDVQPTRGWHHTGAWFAAAASLVASVAFVIALNPATDPGEPTFRTLTSPQVIETEAPRRFALTFEAPAQSDVVRSALIESRSSIIAGPDEAGTYIVEIEVPQSVTPEAFIETLRQIEGISYASLEAGDVDTP